MAKRETGVGNNKTTRSKKTAKRLAIKAEMLAKKEAALGYKGKRK